MITDLSAAITAIQGLHTISSAIQKLKIDNAVREKAIELNFAIIDLQTAIFAFQEQHKALLAEKDDLKEKLMQKEQWQGIAPNYSLYAVQDGIYVYLLKKDKAGSEPVHWLCIKCYQFQQKSILQRTVRTAAGYIYSCYTCSNSFIVNMTPRWPADSA